MFTAEAISILSLGFILGLKHALDADHLVAVSTIVSERKGFWSSSIIGALWGVGHTASLLVVGLVVILFNVHIPEKIAQAMECSVALMLVILGANVLWKIYKGATFHIHVHTHDERLHIHPHLHEPERVQAQNNEHHHTTPIGKKPFWVGVVHGMAGSAALMLLVLTTIPSRMLGLLYIGIFGFGSVGGMLLMSAFIGLPFSLASKYERLSTIIRATAGVVSVGFGLFLMWEIGFVGGLFL